MATIETESDERTPLIEAESSATSAKSPGLLGRKYGKVIIGVSVLALMILGGTIFVLLMMPHFPTNPSAKELEKCAWTTLEDQVSLLSAPDIPRTEFVERQAKLAEVLREEGVDAYIMEPSASSLYYFNISPSYSLSERPFLPILSANGSFSYLAPKFEVGRIGDLEMVYDEKTVIEWAEEESPYAVLRRHFGNENLKVMVDEQTRFFIVSGLQEANFTVVPTSRAVTSLRGVKSYAEIRIMQAINMFTLKAIQSLQPCIQIGITQEAVLEAARGLFARALVGEGFWALVLFGEQAANPHGGATGRKLGVGEFILIDIGSKLYGYGSDVTRTFLPRGMGVSPELLKAWHLVHSAQGEAIENTKENRRCSSVDDAARYV